MPNIFDKLKRTLTTRIYGPDRSQDDQTQSPYDPARLTEQPAELLNDYGAIAYGPGDSVEVWGKQREAGHDQSGAYAVKNARHKSLPAGGEGSKFLPNGTKGQVMGVAADTAMVKFAEPYGLLHMAKGDVWNVQDVNSRQKRWGTSTPDYVIGTLGQLGRYTVQVVDGDAIRNRGGELVDFTEGGNHGRYPDLVDDGVLIIDNSLLIERAPGPGQGKDTGAVQDTAATIIHEYYESNRMLDDDLSYEKAHAEAARLESEFRTKGQAQIDDQQDTTSPIDLARAFLQSKGLLKEVDNTTSNRGDSEHGERDNGNLQRGHRAGRNLLDCSLSRGGDGLRAGPNTASGHGAPCLDASEYARHGARGHRSRAGSKSDFKNVRVAELRRALRRVVEAPGKGDHLRFKDDKGHTTYIDAGQDPVDPYVLSRNIAEQTGLGGQGLLEILGRAEEESQSQTQNQSTEVHSGPNVDTEDSPILRVSGEEFIQSPVAGYRSVQWNTNGDVAARDDASNEVLLADAFFDLDATGRTRALERALKKASAVQTANTIVTATSIVDLKGLGNLLADDATTEIIKVLTRHAEYADGDYKDWTDVEIGPLARSAISRMSYGTLGKFNKVRGIPLLNNPEAEDLCNQVHLVWSAKNTGRLGEFDPYQIRVIINIGTILQNLIFDGVNRALDFEYVRHLVQQTLEHELRHAADWAYQEAARPGKFMDEVSRINEDSSVEGDPYYQQPTEARSFAGETAREVWKVYGKEWRKLGGTILYQEIAQRAPLDFMSELGKEDRTRFAQMVVRALEQLEVNEGGQEGNEGGQEGNEGGQEGNSMNTNTKMSVLNATRVVLGQLSNQDQDQDQNEAKKVDPKEMMSRVRNVLTPELLKPKYLEKIQQGAHPLTGHAYASVESLYHMLGGPGSGFEPTNIRHEGESHWYLRGPNGEVFDPTSEQFASPVPYDKGRGRGFLTYEPSARAKKIMDRVRKKWGSLEASRGVTAQYDWRKLWTETTGHEVPSDLSSEEEELLQVWLDNKLAGNSESPELERRMQDIYSLKRIMDRDEQWRFHRLPKNPNPDQAQIMQEEGRDCPDCGYDTTLLTPSDIANGGCDECRTRYETLFGDAVVEDAPLSWRAPKQAASDWVPQPKWMKSKDLELMQHEQRGLDSDSYEGDLFDDDNAQDETMGEFDWSSGEEGISVPDPVLEPGTPWHLRDTGEGLRDVFRNKPVDPDQPLPPEPEVTTSGEKNRKKLEEKLLNVLSPAQRAKIEKAKRTPAPEKPSDRYVPTRDIPAKSSVKLEEMKLAPDGGLGNILDVLQHARPDEIGYWSKWYEHARSDAKALSDKSKDEANTAYTYRDVPENVVSALIALLSPNTKWEENVFAAEQMLRGQGKKVIDYRGKLDPETASDLALKIYPSLFEGKKETLGSGSYLKNIEKAQRVLDAYERSSSKESFDIDEAQPERLEWNRADEASTSQAEKRYTELVGRGWTARRVKIDYDENKPGEKNKSLPKGVFGPKQRIPTKQKMRDVSFPTSMWDEETGKYDPILPLADTTEPIPGRYKSTWTRGERLPIDAPFPWQDRRLILDPPFKAADLPAKRGENAGMENSAPKVTAFYNSIMHPDKHQKTVVLDGHAINIWRGVPESLSELTTPTRDQREKMIADYKDASKVSARMIRDRVKGLKTRAKSKLIMPEEKTRLLEEAAQLEKIKSLSPQQIQAVTWTVWRDALKNSGIESDDDDDEREVGEDTARTASTIVSLDVSGGLSPLGNHHVDGEVRTIVRAQDILLDQSMNGEPGLVEVAPFHTASKTRVNLDSSGRAMVEQIVDDSRLERGIFEHVESVARPKTIVKHADEKETTDPVGESPEVSPEIAPVTRPITQLEHYSKHPGLSEIDPAFIGSNQLSRRERDDTSVPVSFYYTKGTEHETLLKSTSAALYESELPPNAKIYDMGTDPDGIVAKEYKNGRGALYGSVKNAGYFGFRNSESSLPDVIAVFYKLPAREVRKLRGNCNPRQAATITTVDEVNNKKPLTLDEIHTDTDIARLPSGETGRVIAVDPANPHLEVSTIVYGPGGATTSTTRVHPQNVELVVDSRDPRIAHSNRVIAKMTAAELYERLLLLPLETTIQLRLPGQPQVWKKIGTNQWVGGVLGGKKATLSTHNLAVMGFEFDVVGAQDENNIQPYKPKTIPGLSSLPDIGHGRRDDENDIDWDEWVKNNGASPGTDKKDSKTKKEQELQEAITHVAQSTQNLRKIYELEYKTSILGQERKKGPLADRAERELILGKQELSSRVDTEIELLAQAYQDWLEEAETIYKGANDPSIVGNIRKILGSLLNPPKELPARIVLMHQALTTAHHNASMGTFAYGLGRKNSHAMEDAIQTALDALSEEPDPRWDAEIKHLIGLPRGGSKMDTRTQTRTRTRVSL